MYKIKEIKVQTLKEHSINDGTMDAPEKVFHFFKQVIEQCAWFDSEKECIIVLVLDRKNKLKSFNLVSLGSISSATMHPREVLRPVIVGAGSAFILMHNHPSGDPNPSRADMQVTRQMRESANIMGIDFLDHIIVGDAFYSFNDNGLL